MRDPVPSGRVRTRALSGTHYAGNLWGKTLVGWRHETPQARGACGILMVLGAKWGGGGGGLSKYAKESTPPCAGWVLASVGVYMQQTAGFASSR